MLIFTVWLHRHHSHWASWNLLVKKWLFLLIVLVCLSKTLNFRGRFTHIFLLFLLLIVDSLIARRKLVAYQAATSLQKVLRSSLENCWILRFRTIGHRFVVNFQIEFIRKSFCNVYIQIFVVGLGLRNVKYFAILLQLKLRVYWMLRKQIIHFLFCILDLNFF